MRLSSELIAVFVGLVKASSSWNLCVAGRLDLDAIEERFKHRIIDLDVRNASRRRVRQTKCPAI
jgi:hypothetical protein